MDGLPRLEAYRLIAVEQQHRRQRSELIQLVVDSGSSADGATPGDLVVRLAGRPSLGHPVAVPFGMAEPRPLTSER